jgi:hypothetical protein
MHPFKFNPVWLRDETFAILTRDVWLDKNFELIEGAQRRLVEKLSLLKNRVKSWSKEKLKRDKELLTKLEEDLECLYTHKINGTFTGDLDQQCR